MVGDGVLVTVFAYPAGAAVAEVEQPLVPEPLLVAVADPADDRESRAAPLAGAVQIEGPGVWARDAISPTARRACSSTWLAVLQCEQTSSWENRACQP